MFSPSVIIATLAPRAQHTPCNTLPSLTAFLHEKILIWLIWLYLAHLKFYFVTRFMHKLKVSNNYKCNFVSKLHESKFFRSVIPRNSRNANIIFSPKWSHKITHCTMQVLLLPTQQRDLDHRPSAHKPSNPSQQSQ